MEQDEAESATFATRLNHLFARVHPPDRGPFTTDEVATAVGVSTQAVRYWRQGKRIDPKMGSLQKLASLFGVPVAYFFDDDVADRLNAELDLLLAMRDHGVRRIALRAAGLSPSSQQAIVAMLGQIRQLEGLPSDIDPEPEAGPASR